LPKIESHMQTTLITGATDGIGKIAAAGLATKYKDATILIHGRDKAKLHKTIDDIKHTTSHDNIQGFIADLSSLREVRELASEILSVHDRIDILINNAGAGTSGPRYGKDGTETILTVNYLAPVVLTARLLPALKKGNSARIVNVSSAGQSAIQFDDIWLEKNYDSLTAYTQSKLALIMYTFDLAGQLKPFNITVNALHPGTYLDTNMVRQAGVTPLGTAQSGADAEIYLATSPEVKSITGKYFNVKKEAKAHPQAYDLEARQRLREITQQLTGEDGCRLGAA